MALMVPERPPQKASQGEKKLFQILYENLPDDCYVWYEPIVKGMYPDFIILGPTLGLLILEVKGWGASQIISANNQFFEIKQPNGQVERQQSPLRQGKSYLDNCMDRFKEYPILTQPDGDYQGKLVFPVGVGVIMTNLTAAQAQAENIYSLLKLPQVAYQDELLEWEDMGERELLKRLQAMFSARFKFMPLTDDQINTIKGILHPEASIRSKPATSESLPAGQPLPPGSLAIVSLDIQQEKLAMDVRDGHRLFYGVAGSGKTLILLARAKAIANRLFNNQTLILCFNITLAAYLRSLLEEDEQNPHFQERIEVMHFHGWAKLMLGRLPNPQRFSSEHEYNEALGAELLEALNYKSIEQKWDSILVDEAHTFSPSWFRCCVAALKDSEQGDLMIVSDGSQSLYQRGEFTWKSVGIKATGRSKKLSQNYRNTQEILRAAWSIVQSIPSESDSEEITFPVVEPKDALRHGPQPTLNCYNSREQELAAVIAQIQQLVKIGYDPREIAIIYRYKSQMDTPLFECLIQQLQTMELDCYWVTGANKGRYSTREPGIRLITALSSLGLEFKAVLIPWVQQFGDRHSQEGEAAILARRQLYVAMTRAQQELHLFGSGEFPLLEELRHNSSFCQGVDAAELHSLDVPLSA